MSKVELIKAEERVQITLERMRTAYRIFLRAEERWNAAMSKAMATQAESAWAQTDALYAARKKAEALFVASEVDYLDALDAKDIAAESAEDDRELERVLDALAESRFFGSVG